MANVLSPDECQIYRTTQMIIKITSLSPGSDLPDDYHRHHDHHHPQHQWSSRHETALQSLQAQMPRAHPTRTTTLYLENKTLGGIDPANKTLLDGKTEGVLNVVPLRGIPTPTPDFPCKPRAQYSAYTSKHLQKLSPQFLVKPFTLRPQRAPNGNSLTTLSPKPFSGIPDCELSPPL